MMKTLDYIIFFEKLIKQIEKNEPTESLSEEFLFLYENAFLEEDYEDYEDYDGDLDFTERENPFSFGSLSILTPIENFALFCLVAYESSDDFSERLNSFYGKTILNLNMIRNLASYVISPEAIDLGQLLNPDSFLNTFLINRQGELKGALSFKRGILAYLLGEEYALGLASECVLPMVSADFNDDNPTEENDSYGENILSIMAVNEKNPEPYVIAMCGAEGCGRKHSVSMCANAFGMKVLCVYSDKILTHSEGDSMEYMRRIITKCILEDYFLYIEIGEKSLREPSGLQRIVSMSQDYLNSLFLGVESPLNNVIFVKGMTYLINVEKPNRKSQKSFWRYFAEKLNIVFDEDVDLNSLVSTYDLTPGRIEKTLKSVLPLSELDEFGFHVNLDTLKNCIRSQCVVQFSQFVTRLNTQFTWEDVELSRENKDILSQAIDRVRLRATINDEYGFGRILPYGKGVVIALFGPPGTGKTMTANVIANELGMDIYRIDLSQVGSKYIGETQKNIASIFETAKYSNGILFFDEADALFSKRTDVSTSNDRHANAETAFLLQKIEEYEGVSILATNIISNMDAAFRRRMTYIVNIHNPDEELRRKLWNNVFPKDAPLAPGINLDKFAVLEFAGSNIKSAAVAASYMAAARDGIITEDDILNAVDVESKKLGITGSASAKVRGY